MVNAMRKARMEKSISILELSRRTGVDEKTIWNWENGITTPRLINLIDVCDFLGISIDRYIGRTK